MESNELTKIAEEIIKIIEETGVEDRYKCAIFSELFRFELRKVPDAAVATRDTPKALLPSPGLQQLAVVLGMDTEHLDEVVDFTDDEVRVSLQIPDKWSGKKKRAVFTYIYLTLKSYLQGIDSVGCDELKSKLREYGIADKHRQLSVEIKKLPFINTKKTDRKITITITTRGKQEGVNLIKEMCERE